MPAQDSVIWHDVECGGFEADLPLWEELAGDGGPVLELGCGTGRVALHLARRGHRVWGVDEDAGLIAELRSRAQAESLPVEAIRADAARFRLDQRFRLVLAPMQLIQLLPDAEGRRLCLEAIASHLLPGGLAALAIVETGTTAIPSSPLLPDVREQDGWIHSSLPLGAILQDGWLLVARLRQTVDPEGHLEERRSEVRLRVLSATELEQEARSAGLKSAGRRRIERTDAHVGSTVVLLEA
jgi:SAM-dependent methyltransferase